METQEEFDKIMNEMQKQIEKELYENVAKDRVVLSALKLEVPETYYKDILYYLEECEACTGTLEIVDNPPRFASQSEDEYAFRKTWVDQSCGIMGDDYHGNIWVPLPNNKYLKFYFSM